MTDFPFEGQLIADPVTFQRATNAQVYVYDANDTTNSSPLALKDSSGLPTGNPLVSSADAFVKPIYAPVEDIKYVGAGLTVFVSSAKGMRDAAAASAAAAQTAANSAASAAGQAVAGASVNTSGELVIQQASGASLNAGPVKGPKGDKGDKGDKGNDGANVLPTDAAIQQAINDTASATRGALNATFVPKWKPNTAYLAGDAVLSPAGDTVTAKVNFTSGASFNAANWNYSATFVPATSDTDMAFRALRDTLDSGRSTAIHWSGDSTGDSDGSTTDLRTPTKLAALIAAAYPNYHVRSRKWDDTKGEYAPSVVLQAATGQRYANFNGRSVRYQAANPAGIFTTGNMDLRVKVNMAAPTTQQVFTARTQTSGTSYGTQFQYRFYITPSATLHLAVSYDGASWDDFGASATIGAGLFNADTWFRVTCEIVPGASGSITVKFYTSSDGGATWAQVGATATYGGTRQAMFANSTADFEVGGRDWQPASDALKGKVYEVQIRDGVGGPLLAPANIERWERYGDSATTYGGSPTLWLINASKSGQNLAWMNDAVRMPKMCADYGQTIAFFNTSHNEVSISGQKLWIGPYKTWVNNVLARLPLASPVAVIQNPHTSAWANEATYGESHKMRLDELRAAAGVNRWGTLDLYKAFTNSTAGLTTLIQADGLHPTQAGYDLAGKTAARLAGIVA